MGVHVETERKYEGAALPRRLDRVPGVTATRRAGAQHLDAAYYDTDDLRLLRRGVTLRRRTGGPDAGWHLKLPEGGPDTRREVQVPLDAAGDAAVPAELLRHIAALTRGAGIRKVAHLRTRRSELLLCGAGGHTLARVTEDEVAAQVLDAGRIAGPDRGGAAPGTGREGGGTRTEVCAWTEFEVELEHGEPPLLERLEDAFAEADAVRSRWPSKLARLLGTRPAVGSTDGRAARRTAGALVTGALRTEFDELVRLDAAVREGQEDAVHRMRVRARRLRSLLKAHRKLFEPGPAEALATELRWLGRLLGRARDPEALGEVLVAELDALPAELDRAALRGRLTERCAHAYRHAWQQVVAELDGDRYFALLDALDAFVDDPPLRRRAGRKARGYLSDVLRHEQRRTARRLRRALRTRPGPRRDRALHSARKAAKRSRYAAEQAGPYLRGRAAKRTAAFAARSKKLQKALGTHQDSVVARRELAAVDRWAVGDRQAFLCGVLHERLAATAADVQRGLPRLGRRAGRGRLTRLR
ncbi:CYTH and CHAD domain-containing protein [Streptomyces sp. TLI_171]|uniref:CYTH and CHAD domain-containing protein n=1 Tax=Streptomyces sp. TLI_171 TaxID=1938859 RepID=UPI000C195CFA|nr:CYTH and CHAD domain-containing protein [Streptomyces sp. TLI_171]RKE16885.1 CHAD domain-containing protein [Streptomyces sp. TLI_171]